MSENIHIVGQLPPPVHGSNIMAEIFYRSLKKIGYNVILTQKKFTKNIEDIEKITLLKMIKIPILLLKVICVLIAKKPQICFYFITVKAPTVYLDILILLIFLLFKVPVVLYLHAKGLKRLVKKDLLFQVIGNKVIAKSLGAIVLCESLKTDINDLIANERIYFLPNCIKDTKKNQRSQGLKTTNNIVKVLFLSNVYPEKGPLEFLKVAKLVFEKEKNVKFIIAGPAKSKEFNDILKRFIFVNQLSNIVTLIGPVYGEKKEMLYRDSDIFLFPTHNEAFPLVNLEAMRAGLPVISSNVGCIPQIIVDGVNGFIEDSRDISSLSKRVVQLIENKSLREQMGRVSRERYQAFYNPKSYSYNLKKCVHFFLNIKESIKY